jgi:RNA polymerase sigma-70 factor (ECF subfamily)
LGGTSGIGEEAKGRIDPWSEAAIEQNRRWLTAYLLALTGDRVLVDDLVQEVFLVAYERRASFEPGTNFGGWLRGIARNLALRYWQKLGREPVLSSASVVERLDEASARDEEKSLDPGWQEHIRRVLADCLGELSERARSILEMRYREGRSSAEVATALGQSVSSVNVTAFRARVALGECLKRKQGAWADA